MAEDDYVPQEYPKFLAEFNCVVQNKEEHDALKAGQLEVVETRSAQGSNFVAAPKKVRPKKGEK